MKPSAQHLPVTEDAGQSSEHQTNPHDPEHEHGCLWLSLVVRWSLGWTPPRRSRLHAGVSCRSSGEPRISTIRFLSSSPGTPVPEHANGARPPLGIGGQSHYGGKGGAGSTKK